MSTGRGIRVLWFFIVLFIVIVALYSLNIWLNWTIMESMYKNKAGLDWFGTVFYHGYTFYLAAILALIVINPSRGKSDIYSAVSAVITRAAGFASSPRFRRYSDYRDYRVYGQESGIPPTGTPVPSLSNTIWGIWQIMKYVLAFFIISALQGFPFFGNLVMPVYMALNGYGSWGLVPRIAELPLNFATANELIGLMPTMQIEYFIIYSVIGGIVALIAFRLFLKAIRDFALSPGNRWMRDAVLFASMILIEILIGSPYWATDASTPYRYGIVVSLIAFTLLGWIYLKLSGKGVIPVTVRRRRIITIAGIILIAALIFNVGATVFIYLNWNNRWPQYEWTPFIQKQIAVTDWSSGVQGLNVTTISNLPAGNTDMILSLVRQWGQQQAQNTMTKEVGSNNWMAPAGAQIVWVNNTEYWIAPTTISYPSGTDWRAQHLIYTHTDRVILINTHNGQQISLSSAFGAPQPLIYYGEGSAFTTSAYVRVADYNEINNQSYPGQPDYVLSGWQRMLWFLLRGQFGFAFSPPNSSIDMLYNRNIFNRVGDILINGLQIDPEAYMVTDGQKIFYLVQVYISYPMNSAFSFSPYLRFFGVVLIDPTNGNMTGYLVPNQNYDDNFLMSFYRSYYNWQQAPSWLIPQLRYPDALLGTPSPSGQTVCNGQLTCNFIFHVTDPYVWLSGSGFYEYPTDAQGNPVGVLYVAYVIGNTPYFVALQEVEYQNSVSKNLAGIYIIFGGNKLGEMYLYQVPANSTSALISPTGAYQAFLSNQQVKTQLTLLGGFSSNTQSTPTSGSPLLYVINGKLYYFIPEYLIPSSSAVVAQMPFIAAVNPYTAQVAIGQDAAQAYYNLVGQAQPTQSNMQLLQENVSKFFSLQNVSLINVTKIGADAFVQVGSVNFTSLNDWNNVKSLLSSFAINYVQKYGAQTVFVAPDGNNTYSYGVLVQQEVTSHPLTNILILYYVQVTY
ncbi:MAG: hypothetical protein QXQ39_03485 [Conexivisphaerales archaeon]